MIARSFYFLRHGETDENARKVLQGRFDSVLNETGRSQTLDAAQILKNHPIDRIISSPLKRAAETASIVSQLLQKPVEFADEFMERNYGLYEGKTTEQIVQWKIDNNYNEDESDPETRYTMPPQGEVYKDFKNRVFQAFQTTVKKYETENLLFVSHGGVFKSLHIDLIKERVESKNAHPYYFNNKSGFWQLDCLVTTSTE